MEKKLLVIDDDPDLRTLLSRFLERNGYAISSAGDGASALQVLRDTTIDVALCDFQLPDLNGAELLQKMRVLQPNIKVVIITAYSDVETAVMSMKSGAFDYVTKPINHEEILHTIESALKATKQPQISGKKQEEKKCYVEGASQNAKMIKKHIELVAPTDMSVVIEGETGTGKEAVARQIHEKSKRSEMSFVTIDCGALPKDIAGSELFGHVKGAFTGAVKDKPGLFEEANGGTLFLDEIGNLSYDVQVQLLRILQEKKLRRIGSNVDKTIDVRIVAATNDDLLEAVEEGGFREDLFHRLNEFQLRVAPLRERKEDIDLFAGFFLNKGNNELGKKVVRFEHNVMEVFHRYHWKGNLREMYNVVKRSILLCDGDIVTMDMLPKDLIYYTSKLDNEQNSNNNGNLKSAALNAELKVILDAIKKANGNKSEAARILNIDRKTLYNKLKSLDVEV